MTDLDALHAALVDAAPRGTPPPCVIDPTGGWLSDDPDQRAHAATLCRGCSVLDECRAVGAGEKFGVWAGTDRTGGGARTIPPATKARVFLEGPRTEKTDLSASLSPMGVGGSRTDRDLAEPDRPKETRREA